MSTEEILLAVAMPEEAAFLRHLTPTPVKRRNGASAPLWRGQVAGKPLLLTVTGEGSWRTRTVIEDILARHTISRVIGLGVAGALSRELLVGDLILAHCVVDAAAGQEQSAVQYQADQECVFAASNASAVLGGICLSTEQLVLSREAKTKLRETYASIGLATVDLESATLAKLASEKGIPWLILRAVSDTAEETLPALFAQCMNQDGTLDRTAIALKAAIRPSTWPRLLRLRHRVNACARRLSEATVRIVEADG